jgi:hypothetical protein
MEKKYAIVFDAVTGQTYEREFTKEEYAQAELDEQLTTTDQHNE